jgi:hypothetical protein
MTPADIAAVLTAAAGLVAAVTALVRQLRHEHDQAPHTAARMAGPPPGG